MGGRMGDSCRRGWATLMVGGGSSSKSGSFDVKEFFRDRRPLSSVLEAEFARCRPTFSCNDICKPSSVMGIEWYARAAALAN